MARVEVRHLENIQFEVTIRDKFRLVGDEPPERQGDDAGPTPFEFLMAALGG